LSVLDDPASKGAIVTFTNALALSALESGVRMNAATPDPVGQAAAHEAEGKLRDEFAVFGLSDEQTRALRSKSAMTEACSQADHFGSGFVHFGGIKIVVRGARTGTSCRK
jgi:NAD(P)-dependent dehydrogenase (short-subunit alcohol dehydrogenase family)